MIQWLVSYYYICVGKLKIWRLIKSSSIQLFLHLIRNVQSQTTYFIKIVQNYNTFEMMTQSGAYVIPKLSDVHTSTEQMQICFRTFLAKCAQIIFNQAKSK